MTYKKIFIIVLVIVALAAGGFFLVKKVFWKSAPEKVYEALVMVTDQKASDPVEDARSSLKAGDVITILPEGHKWSDTEQISYLILKLKLTEEEARKLMAPEQVEKKAESKAELSDRQSSALDKSPALDKQTETVRARAYRLKIETLGFDVQKFWQEQKQPYEDRVFGWELAEEKK